MTHYNHLFRNNLMVFVFSLLLVGCGGGGDNSSKNNSDDITPPTVPTNLIATAVSSTQISLSWPASTDDVGVAGYRIYRDGTEIATVIGANYSDSGLTASTSYSYMVTYDAAGNTSNQSAGASTTTQALIFTESICDRWQINHPDWILCEDWEDGDHVGWTDWNSTASWGGPIWGGHTCLTGSCAFPFAGYQSNQGLAAYLTEDTQGTIYPSHYFSQLEINDTVYLRYDVYWSESFVFNPVTNKNSYFWSSDNASRVAFQLRPPANGTGDLLLGRPLIHLYCSQTDLETTQEGIDFCYGGGDARFYPNIPDHEDFTITGGKWYSIELRITPNPSGESYGAHLQYWIDGVLMADYDNTSIRHASATQPINRIQLNSYHGGGVSPHPDQYVIYDNIVVSRNYIGITIPSTATTTPIAPISLIATRVPLYWQ